MLNIVLCVSLIFFALFLVLCFVVSATDCCMLWDSENGITGSTSVALSVVMPVHVVYATVGRWSALCVHASTKIVLFESLTSKRSF